MTSLDYKTLESEEIMGKLGIRNIYELVVYQTVNVICYHARSISDKISNSTTQIRDKTQKNNFEKLEITFKVTEFAISARGPRL